MIVTGFCLLVTASGAQPESLIQQAIKAEAHGDLKNAYLLWAQAAVRNPEVWAKAKALEPHSHPIAETGPEPEPSESADYTGTISNRDLDDARRLGEPVHLKPNLTKHSFRLRGDVKTLYEGVSREYGYVPVLDRDLQNAPATQLRFDLEDADYQSALHALEAATNTFIVPVSDSVLLAAQDTQQKRNELEPTAVQVFLIPSRSSVQEAQEILTAIQQSLELRRTVLDPGKRMILMRGPYSRVRIAEALLRQFMAFKPQVMVEVELLTFAENKSRSWGLGLMNSTNLVNFGQAIAGAVWANPSSMMSFLGFGGGSTFLGLGIGAAQILASATQSEATSVMKSEVMVVDGQAATFHVGEKYPIVTSEYSGLSASTSGLGSAPNVTFEDLGLILKVTPSIHSMEEVSLDVEAEYKSITGSGVNGIPIISDRKLQSKVRLNADEWGVVTGLMTRQDTHNMSGIAGLSKIPWVGGLFRNTTKSSDFSDAMILIKPIILSVPPNESPTKTLWVGSDTRWRTVL